MPIESNEYSDNHKKPTFYNRTPQIIHYSISLQKMERLIIFTNKQGPLSTFVLLQKILFPRCKEIILGDMIKLLQKIRTILIFFSAIRRSRLS